MSQPETQTAIEPLVANLFVAAADLMEAESAQTAANAMACLIDQAVKAYGDDFIARVVYFWRMNRERAGQAAA